MKLKEIHRTSTFAWSPFSSLPLLATGTVAGALDASFSNDSQLEIWDPDFLNKSALHLGSEGQPGPNGVVTTTSRFNRLAWGIDASRPRGILAAGMESGELGLWDPEKILANADVSESCILKNNTHTGPVRALDFNSLQTNLLSSGAVNGEIYIWDLKDPSKPYSPGTRSSKLDDVTALAWNARVPHVLATSSSSGYTVVWDLRGKKEVVALAYGGGAGTTGAGSGAALAVGGRRGMSDVAWHPDNATRLVTSSEDDSSPVIMVWDLRNARAPEKILTGHDKGVLSLSWCKQDADLLLSCGKDNRALLWNPQTSEMIGELPTADNWAFQVQWCPRNPDLLATATFDGTIGIHSLQTTNEPETPVANVTATFATQQGDGSDMFDQPNFNSSSRQSTLSLKQPPKWLRRPASGTFGFGGQLVTVSNLPSAQGTHQSGVVHLRKIATEPAVVDRATKLQTASDEQKLAQFAEEKSQVEGEGRVEGWKALSSLFRANSRDELVTLLGFSKEEVALHVAEAIKKVNAQPAPQPTATSIPVEEEDVTEVKPYEPVVSFAEPERDPEPLSEPAEGPVDNDQTLTTNAEATPSEVSASATSDVTKGGLDVESTATEPSLFGDDFAVGTPQGDPNVDFFSSMGNARSALPEHVLVPHHSYAADSSVAATAGSRPSSAASDQLKSNTFKIYPNEESEIDRLVTKSLVLGDFESAVSLCLSAERYADAILLAVKGGPELLSKTQAAYFTRQTTSLPYLRLYQSIVTNDLTDIVQNADLREWQEIFVILCTFAREDEFSGLAKQLGQRLEFQGKVAKAADPDGSTMQAKDYRKNATLCYLAAGKLEHVVSIWVEEMKEEESAVVASDEGDKAMSRYTSHALALQSFIEKVTVFKNATSYSDSDLTGSAPTSDAKSYKLASLYDRYYEYADLLAAQGLLKEAVKYIGQTPADYKGSKGGADVDFDIARERVLLAANLGEGRISTSRNVIPSITSASVPATAPIQPQNAYAPTSYGIPQQQQQQQQQPPPTVKPSPYESMYSPPNGSTVPATGGPRPHDPYAPVGGSSLMAPPQQQPYRPQQPMQSYAPPTGAAYNPSYGAPSYTSAQTPYANPGIVPPPGPAAAPPLRAPPKRTDQGWNDTPEVISRRSTPGAPPKTAPVVAAITSPFPNMQQPVSPGGPGSPYQQQQQGGASLPPPPRAGSQFGHPQQQQQQHLPPPPPRGGSAMGRGQPPPPQSIAPQGQQQYQPPPPPPSRVAPTAQGGPPPFTRPTSGGGNPPPGVTYPTRAMSPLSRAGGGYPPDRTMSPLAPQSQAGRPPPPQQGQYGHPPTQAQMQMRIPAGSVPPPSLVQQQGGPPPPGPPPSRGPYAPGPGSSHPPPPQAGPGQYRPQQQSINSPPGSVIGPPGAGGPPPGPPGPPPPGRMQGPPSTPAGGSAPPPPAAAAQQSKYPPGDRSHIPESTRPAFIVLSDALSRLKQATPPQQKRMADDTERRLNVLFDALNCETLSPLVTDQLLVLTQALERRDHQSALATHADLLTKGSRTDDIGLWMSAVKVLITRV